MSSKLEPVIWLRDTGHIGIHGGADGRTCVRTDVHDVMAIKPNFLTSMGYHIFLAMVRARSSAITKINSKFSILWTVPTIVIGHTFCASPDTRISYR